MKVVLYTHSLVSDWNHGNAHFLRGVLTELQRRGHQTLSMEPENGWSRQNLLADQGQSAVDRFARDFPMLEVQTYKPDFDHAAAIDGAGLVIVHEWTDADLVAKLGHLRRHDSTFALLFHDTHHRGISDATAIADLALAEYDAVLAFGEILSERYRERGWGKQVFTWHEAADIRLFRPRPSVEPERDMIWIGNWGDGERERELIEFLLEPAQRLQLSGEVRGVRYPDAALSALAASNLNYRGWIANTDAPAAFARHKMTVHIPRGPYVHALPGIPTIRMFEALACGIPLVSAPWHDVEGLFRSDKDYMRARNPNEMIIHLQALRCDSSLRAEVARSGLQTILDHHTCAHRVDELFDLLAACGKAHNLQEPQVQEAIA